MKVYSCTWRTTKFEKIARWIHSDLKVGEELKREKKTWRFLVMKKKRGGGIAEQDGIPISIAQSVIKMQSSFIAFRPRWNKKYNENSRLVKRSEETFHRAFLLICQFTSVIASVESRSADN